MRNVAWFVAGCATCIVLLILFSSWRVWTMPYGKIAYRGSSIEVTSDSRGLRWLIGEDGKSLGYGMYQVHLRNGDTLTIHKNNRGNALVTETNGLVVVRADENVIDVWLEKGEVQPATRGDVQ